MPTEPFLNAPCQIDQLLSRRGMLYAGLLPLLTPARIEAERAKAELWFNKQVKKDKTHVPTQLPSRNVGG